MRFLAFEGLDGSGKSTLMKGLKTELDGRAISYVETREPGGTRLGEDVRTLLLRDEDPPTPRAEALLYQAARAHHVERVIRPALRSKKWVLCDRFAASSIAFQAGGRDIAPTEIEWLNAFATRDLKPDLYVLLDLTVEESTRRLAGRAEQSDRFEREAKDFHERVRAAYLSQARAEPARWLVLSAAVGPEQLAADLTRALRERSWLD